MEERLQIRHRIDRVSIGILNEVKSRLRDRQTQVFSPLLWVFSDHQRLVTLGFSHNALGGQPDVTIFLSAAASEKQAERLYAVETIELVTARLRHGQYESRDSPVVFSWRYAGGEAGTEINVHQHIAHNSCGAAHIGSRQVDLAVDHLAERVVVDVPAKGLWQVDP